MPLHLEGVLRRPDVSSLIQDNAVWEMGSWQYHSAVGVWPLYGTLSELSYLP